MDVYISADVTNSLDQIQEKFFERVLEKGKKC